MRKGIENDKTDFTNSIMAVPDRIGRTFGSILDRQIAVAGSGEADHADSNRCLVCQYAAMDVEGKGAIA